METLAWLFGVLYILPMSQQPLVGHGLIVEASRSHSHTPHSVWLLWTSDQPDAETSTWQHWQEACIHTLGGIRTLDPSKRAAADPRLSPRCYSDRLIRRSVSRKERLAGFHHGVVRVEAEAFAVVDYWYLVTDVSGQPVGPIFKGQHALRNVAEQLRP
jgi:hypothetical protein